MASFLTDTTFAGSATFAGNVLLGDNTYIKIGASSDFEIHHSSMGTGTFISETGPGDLYIISDTGVILKSGQLGENYANFTKDGPIELYYDNSKKFATTSSGVSITGSIAVTDAVTTGGNLTINVPDGGGAPAMSATLLMQGYEGRGIGMKLRDAANSASNSSNREWFVGSGYNSSGFNIGYASDGSQSSYQAKAKLNIDTSGNAVFAGTVTANGVTLTGTQTTVSGNAGSVTNGVYTIGTQSIGGAKTFTTTPISVTRSTADSSAYLATTAFVKNQNYTSNVGDITGVTAGTGLSGGGTSGTVSLGVDLSELNDIDGDDPQITDFVVVSSEDESVRISLANTKTALGVNKNQFVLNSNFSDDSSTTSYIYMPFNSISDTTSAQYYVHWAAPCTGRIKRIVMQHVYGSMSSSFTTQLQVYKNGSTFATSGQLTPSNGTNDGSYIEYNPSGSSTGNVSFVKGDRIRIRYNKSASSKYWRGVAASIIIELDQV